MKYSIKLSQNNYRKKLTFFPADKTIQRTWNTLLHFTVNWAFSVKPSNSCNLLQKLTKCPVKKCVKTPI